MNTNDISLIVISNQNLYRSSLIQVLSQNASTVIGFDNYNDFLNSKSKFNDSIILFDVTNVPEGGLAILNENLSRSKQKLVILTISASRKYCKKLVSFGVKGIISLRESLDNLLLIMSQVNRNEICFSPIINSILASESINNLMPEETVPVLTKSERHILSLLAKGLSNGEIAKTLEISPRTVETHRAHIYKKLGFKGTARLVHYAMENNIVIN